MKNKWVLIGILLLLLLAIAAILYPKLAAEVTADGTEPPSAWQEPVPALDFTLTDAEGNEKNLSDFYGKPIVLNFWATWCGPCKSELPAIDALAAEYGEEVTFLIVDLTDGRRDTADGVKQFVDDMGYTFPLYFDMECRGAEAYGVRSVPSTLFIDPDGNAVGAYVGAMTEEILRTYLDELKEL